jgi:hypothetical protein
MLHRLRQLRPRATGGRDGGNISSRRRGRLHVDDIVDDGRVVDVVEDDVVRR